MYKGIIICIFIALTCIWIQKNFQARNLGRKDLLMKIAKINCLWKLLVLQYKSPALKFSIYLFTIVKQYRSWIVLCTDHQNYLGVDDNLGPVAISFKREKLDEKERETSTGKAEGGGFCYQYRIIVRTGEVRQCRKCEGQV